MAQSRPTSNSPTIRNNVIDRRLAAARAKDVTDVNGSQSVQEFAGCKQNRYAARVFMSRDDAFLGGSRHDGSPVPPRSTPFRMR